MRVRTLGYRRNPGPTEKVLQDKKRMHISGPQLYILASILKFLKIFSEAIVASTRGLLTWIEKQSLSKKLDLLKSFSKIREAPV